MKKILSALLSMTVAFGAVPVVSNAEDTQYSEQIPPSVQPYTVDGDTVVFEGGKDYDFIVSSYSKFTSERKDKSFTFTPSYNSTSFLISRVYIAEEIINYSFEYNVPLEAPYNPEDTTTVTTAESHCHYFYPVIQNFAVTYNINIGTQVEYIGERSYRNETNIKKITSGSMGVCFDYFEDYDTDKICNSGDYYSLASHIADNNMFFTFFDYGYEYTKKDKSVFCLKTPYSIDDVENSYIDVSGNAIIADTFLSETYTDGNLIISADDMFSYTTIEPTTDGFVEIYCPDIMLMSSIILNVANGKFIPSYSTIGCVLPDYGDLNMDNYINIADAVIFQKYLFGQTKLTNIQSSCADLNFDGIIDIFDMVLIRQKIIEDNHIGLIPEPYDTIK
ncbi:MAG: dockerin type I repeat-containing protein [Ruminococcus sp.]|nr:dockerin type I repeat-containing protein [Ruminococcus sp.]